MKAILVLPRVWKSTFISQTQTQIAWLGTGVVQMIVLVIYTAVLLA